METMLKPIQKRNRFPWRPAIAITFFALLLNFNTMGYALDKIADLDLSGKKSIALPEIPEACVHLAYETNIYGRIIFSDSFPKSSNVYMLIGDPSGKHYRYQVNAGSVVLYFSADGKNYAAAAPVDFPASSPLEFSRTEGTMRFYSRGRLIAGTKLEKNLPLNLYYPAAGIKVKVHKTGPLRMTDDFMRKVIGENDAWRIVAGRWESLYHANAAASPNPFICRGNADAETGIILAGYPFWNNYSLAIALKPGHYPETGLVFGYRGPGNYFKATLSKKNGRTYVSLVRLADGKASILAKRELFYPTGRWFNFAAEVYEGEPFKVMIDRVEVLSCPEEFNTFGKAGLLIRRGSCLYDDFLASSRPAPGSGKEALRLVGKKSRAYSRKRKFLEDDRDQRLFRWAKETDAWPALTVEYGHAKYPGRYYRLPFFGDFSFSTQNRSDDTLFVIRDWEGRTLKLQPLPQPGPAVLSRRQDKLYLNGKALTTGALPSALYVGLHFREGSSRRDTYPEIRSNSIRHELFENATVDWYPVYGYWKNTSRWGCAPKWKFFSGLSLNAAILFSKTTYEGDQVHEINYALKDMIGGRRVTLECDGEKPRLRRYIRNDVNFSFLTDGKDVFSGYTFMYGGYYNRASYLYRGRELVATNKEVRFPRNEKYYLNGRLEPNVFDQHLFWRRFRFERFGRRIRVLFEDKVVFDYTETAAKMPAGGHLALWTYRNGIIYARLDSAAEKISPAAEEYVLAEPGEEGLPWQALDPNNVILSKAGEGKVKVTNRFGGGEFAVSYNLSGPVDLVKTPKLKLWLDLPRGVAVNLHLQVNNRRIVYALTAPVEKTYRVLRKGPPPDLTHMGYFWRLFGKKPLAPPIVGGTPRESIKGEITIDLLAELKARFPGEQSYRLASIIIGNSSQKDYLMAGLSGNAAGASYTAGIPRFTE